MGGDGLLRFQVQHYTHICFVESCLGHYRRYDSVNRARPLTNRRFSMMRVFRCRARITCDRALGGLGVVPPPRRFRDLRSGWAKADRTHRSKPNLTDRHVSLSSLLYLLITPPYSSPDAPQARVRGFSTGAKGESPGDGAPEEGDGARAPTRRNGCVSPSPAARLGSFTSPKEHRHRCRWWKCWWAPGETASGAGR